jgi:3-methyladenine DNA glycosylase AlkD
MQLDEVVAWLEENGSEEEREKMTRYGIPNERAVGISVGDLKRFSKEVGPSHDLAGRLWETGWYEARMLAAFVDEPGEVTEVQMDAWVRHFDSWAVCDTVCFHLFDRTRFAWKKVEEWAPAEEEFVRRAAYALIWALSVHDKGATDGQFIEALEIIQSAEPDPRPLVKKAVDMALRATGKRNAVLNRAAIDVAEALAESGDASRAWIGRHAARELRSEKVRKRLVPPPSLD